jgi:hypothetical protein
MSNSTHLYRQLLDLLRQYSQANDLRHFKALAWMVSAQDLRKDTKYRVGVTQVA